MSKSFMNMLDSIARLVAIIAIGYGHLVSNTVDDGIFWLMILVVCSRQEREE